MRALEGRVALSLAALQRSGDVIRNALGEQDYQYAINLYLQSVLSFEMADYRTTLRLCQASKSIFQKSVTPDHIALTWVDNQVALLSHQIGRFDLALQLLNQNVAVLEKTLGPEKPEVAASLSTLGRLQWTMGDYLTSRRTLERCLAIYERAERVGDPLYAAAVNNLALTLMSLGDDAGAWSLFKESAATLQKKFGNENAELAIVVSNWGVLAESLDRTETAKTLYEHALSIRLKAFGEDHPAVGDTLSHLGSLSLKLGDTPRALDLIQKGLTIRVRSFGREHLSVSSSLNLLADAHMANKEYSQAIPLLFESSLIAAKNLGVDHPIVFYTLGEAALACEAVGETLRAMNVLSEALDLRRSYLIGQFSGVSESESSEISGRSAYQIDRLHSLCGLVETKSARLAAAKCAEQLAFDKALSEEIQAVRASLESDQSKATRALREQHLSLRGELAALVQAKLDPIQRESKRKQLLAEVDQIETKIAERLGLVGQTLEDRESTLTDVALSLPSQAVLLDLIHFERCDFASPTNQWKEQRYAAYLTFPLAEDSTNVVVERVDLGEAAPINEAVELICRRMGAGQFRAKDLEAALQRVSELVYAPLARHLTNVSHLIVCPDGQLSRVPFEMLLVSGRGEPPRYLVEEKTVSYVGSGREVARLAQPSTQVKTNAPVVMGNPDFNFALSSSSRREEALSSGSPGVSKQNQSERNARPHSGPLPQEREKATNGEVRLLTSAATKTLSRSYRGIKFGPLPGSEAEAMNVAKLLGGDTVLCLGAEAREAELKAVVSPRVLHLATHGFFLTDQEFKRTNAGPGLLAAGAGTVFGSQKNIRTRWNASLPENDWENPMVRCGIALAGANHAAHITNAVAEDGLLTGLEASLLNLQGTELVILSACESGAGEVKIGEGVMSLRRAFRIAGAETVLASHWKVSDQATRRLMSEFMRRWRAGEPRAKAWREAQLALLRSEKFSNPYFWAAFTLTGQWR